LRGEKSADAAARVFPNSVCITSPAFRGRRRADWTPLSGRKVRVWPDHDEWEKCAAEIARILHGLEAEVSVIDAAALASRSPDGGKREPIAKWDAADAVMNGRILRRCVGGSVVRRFRSGAFVLGARSL
jgi:hypothetical protein